MIKPLGNYALIEVLEEYSGLAGNPKEGQHRGKLIDFSVMADHLTEGGGYEIALDSAEQYAKKLKALLNKVVYYQEYADSGRKFKHDGKDYVMVPWYRIYGYESEAE